jgi:hypothetical protein
MEPDLSSFANSGIGLIPITHSGLPSMLALLRALTRPLE